MFSRDATDVFRALYNDTKSRNLMHTAHKLGLNTSQYLAKSSELPFLKFPNQYLHFPPFTNIAIGFRAWQLEAIQADSIRYAASSEHRAQSGNINRSLVFADGVFPDVKEYSTKQDHGRRSSA